MGQLAYAWYDPRLVAWKIGKTEDEKRFLQRCQEALGSNPLIQLVGAWRTDIRRPQDAGEFLASGLTRVDFGTSAREWFKAQDTQSLLDRANNLFGRPAYSSVPEKIRQKQPWDPFGNIRKAGDGASRIWLHQENRRDGLRKLSDNSWWRPNLNPSWNNTFNPTGFQLVGAFEWPGLETRQSEWSELNRECRSIKFAAQQRLGIGGIPNIAKIGWLDCSTETAKQFIMEAGLAEFDFRGPIRIGVLGQGERH